MDARSELLAYMGTAVITVAGLFGLQHWYASYLDVHVVHASLYDVPPNAKMEQQRKEWESKLTGGPMPIDKAKEALAQSGRTAFAKIAPKPSEDLSAMSGWMHRPGFKPYQPRAAQPAAQPEPAEAAVAPGEGQGQGATAPAGEGASGDPTPAPGAQPAEGQ